LQNTDFLSCPHMRRESKPASGAFYGGANDIGRCPHHLPKAPPLNPIPLGVRVTACEFGTSVFIYLFKIYIYVKDSRHALSRWSLCPSCCMYFPCPVSGKWLKAQYSSS
jgi:hypothetical protein